MPPSDPPRPPARLHALDGLRGLCAFVVVFFHLFSILRPDLPPGSPITLAQALGILALCSPAGLILNGHNAVIVFFVISGISLSLAPDSASLRTWPSFLTERFFRLWPPFAVALLAAFLCAIIAPAGTGGLPENHWFRDLWDTPATWSSLAGQILMTGTRNTLDWPAWSLVTEFRVSLIFPLLFLAVRRSPVPATLIALLLSLAAMAAMPHVPSVPELYALLSVPVYAVLFVAGILIARHRTRLAERLAALSPRSTVLFWLMTSFLLSTPLIENPPGFTTAGSLTFLITSAGAILLTAAVTAGSRGTHWLTHPVFQFQGRISYSLYLLHLPVTALCVRLARPFISVPATLLTGFCLSVLLAMLSRTLVEIPSARFGKRLAARLKPREKQPRPSQTQIDTLSPLADPVPYGRANPRS